MTTLCSIAVADGEDYDDDDGDDHDVDGLEKYQQAMLYIYIFIDNKYRLYCPKICLKP